MSPASRVKHEIWPRILLLTGYFIDLSVNNLREVTEEYNRESFQATDAILELLLEGLRLEKNALKLHLGGDLIDLEMKINFYPPCPKPQLALGVEPHTDMSAITILVPNDVPGLQVWKDGSWVAVDYNPGTLFVHIDDQIEALSNGKYKSVLPKSLVNKDRTRMLWAVFCAPPVDAVIGPTLEIVDEQNPAKFSTKTFAEFHHRKFNKLHQ